MSVTEVQPGQTLENNAALEARLAALRATYAGADAQTLLKAMIVDEFPGEIAVVSSFGSEAIVLLHLVSQIAPSTPVVFLNTGKLFGETLRYRDQIRKSLGLTDLRSLTPSADDETAADPNGNLWRLSPDSCCHFRKVVPLQRELKKFKAEVSGRKRFQTKARAAMETLEINDGRIKVNPLANWDLQDLRLYIEDNNLPRHPLVNEGYLSIGCFPCTDRATDPNDYRSGRWSGLDKDECGIHEQRLIDGEGI